MYTNRNVRDTYSLGIHEGLYVHAHNQFKECVNIARRVIYVYKWRERERERAFLLENYNLGLLR